MTNDENVDEKIFHLLRATQCGNTERERYRNESTQKADPGEENSPAAPVSSLVSRFGPAVRRWADKRKDLGSIPASALLSLQKDCGLWTLSCDFVHHFLLKH